MGWRTLGRGCFLLLLLCSCEHKDLCYHHPHEVTIRVEFDWRNAPEANPAGMCVFFYPEEGGEPRRFDFIGTKGGEIELTVGNYRVLCYNNDTEGVLFLGKNSFEQHEAYTREGDILESIYGSGYYAKTPRAKGAEEERVVICPDMLWGCTATEVEIDEAGMSYICVPEEEKDNLVPVESREHIITLYPAELTCIYTYEIRNVKNLKHATQMCASLSGMAGSLFVSSTEVSRECVTIPFTSTKDQHSNIIGRFITFGHHEENSEPHNLLLYVFFKNDAKYYYTFDVTNQVNNAPNKRRVHIIIDNVEFPDFIEDEGFSITVDEWIVQEEDIKM